MDDTSARAGHIGLHPSELLPGETVLRHWSAPHGLGVLTGMRLLLLGPRSPIHRKLEWIVALNEISSIEVVQLDDLPQYGAGAHAAGIGGMRFGGAYYQGSLPGSFDVRVDGVTVFRGTPAGSEEVQGWIDGAKSDLDRTRPGGSQLRT